MDTLRPSERSERMSRVRSRDTAPELRVRRAISSLGYRFRLHVRGIPGRPDIVFRARRAAIFVHGCFWHRHSCKNGRRAPKTRRKFWKAKFEENVKRDRRVRAELRRLGWRVLVVWECQLHDEAKLRDRVAQFLQRR